MLLFILKHFEIFLKYSEYRRIFIFVNVYIHPETFRNVKKYCEIFKKEIFIPYLSRISVYFSYFNLQHKHPREALNINLLMFLMECFYFFREIFTLKNIRKAIVIQENVTIQDKPIKREFMINTKLILFLLFKVFRFMSCLFQILLQNKHLWRSLTSYSQATPLPNLWWFTGPNPRLSSNPRERFNVIP